jgi:hypothetical protein
MPPPRLLLINSHGLVVRFEAAQSLLSGVSSACATMPPSARGAAARAESASASTRVGNVFAERAISIESCCRMICHPNGAVDGPRLVMRKR